VLTKNKSIPVRIVTSVLYDYCDACHGVIKAANRADHHAAGA
jgi:hypothetical protein